MELEKLQNIIADVLNVDASEVTMNTTFPELSSVTIRMC